MHPGPTNIWRKVEVEPWSKWFAWHPVKVQGKRVWLKTICRRKICKFGGDNGEWFVWEYGTIFDVLKQSQ